MNFLRRLFKSKKVRSEDDRRRDMIIASSILHTTLGLNNNR